MGMKYTKEDCIESLHEAVEVLGKSPTWEEYNQIDVSPSGSTIQQRFGNWNTAKEEAELDIQKKHNNSTTKSDVVGSIKRCKEELGRVPSKSEYENWKSDGSYGIKTVERLCQNWTEAVELAGLEVLGSGKLEIDEDYFEVIDSPTKSYWLGFFLADGCVSEASGGAQWKFGISLKRQDKEHLRKFLKDCNSDHKIHDTDNGANGGCYLHIAIQKFCNDLRDKGVRVRDKTIPEIPVEYRDELIRGYFDGDGCIQIYERESRTDDIPWSIGCVKEDNIDTLIDWLGDEFWNGYLNKNSAYENHENTTTSYAVKTSSHKNIKKLYERLWNDDYRTVRCLSRKGKKMEEAVERIDDTRERRSKTKSIYEFV